MLTQLLAIIRNTFVESVRQPIMAVLVILGCLALPLVTAGAGNTIEDDNHLFIQIAMSTLLIIGVFMAGFTATGVLTLELENKTVLTVVSKPVTRPLFILGKYLGVALAVSLGMWSLFMVTVLCTRHGVLQTAAQEIDWPVMVFGLAAFFLAVFGSLLLNYLYRWPWVSTFIYFFAAMITLAGALILVVSKSWTIQPVMSEFHAVEGRMPIVVTAMLLLHETLLILCAAAIMLSTRLGQVLTIGGTAAFAAAMTYVQPIKDQIDASQSGGLVPAVWRIFIHLLDHLIPNLSFLWVVDELTSGYSVNSTYVASVSAYSLLFIIALLAGATALFQGRDVG
jgi:ABC-type transport system involved in multi-copper enzyme maturation permease subunit